MEEDRDRQSQDDVLAFDLYKNTMTGEWGNIVKMYKEQKFSAIDARINSSGDTAFHVAVSIAPEEIVQQLIRVIALHSEPSLRLTNYEGNTPLHVAASAGRLNICILLAAKVNVFSELPNLEVHQDLFRNKLGETPLFLAAFHGYKPIFLYLHSLLLEASDKDLDSVNPAYRRNDGETALHCAIRWEYFDVAFEILAKEPNLAYSVNEQVSLRSLEVVPTSDGGRASFIIVSITQLRSRKSLNRFNFVDQSCTYITRIHVEELEHETVHKDLIDSVIKELHESSEKDNITDKFPKNYQTCIGSSLEFLLPSCFSFLAFGSKNMNCKGRKADEESASEGAVIGQSQKEGIRKIKRKHVHSIKIMEILIEEITKDARDFTSGTDPGHTIKRHGSSDGKPSLTDGDSATTSKPEQQDGNKINETDKVEKNNGKGKERNGITEMVEQILQKFPMAINDNGKEMSKMTKMETPILLAARNGITEMVEYLLKKFPLVIADKSEGKNIVLWAAKNRQTHVLQLLLKQRFVKRKLIHEVDMNENNALHLAAEIGKQRPWLIPGAALQMQWEIKWYEFVKDNMPQHFCYQVNKDNKTPEEIFNETHEDLVTKGGEWLDKTAESCSVVAALIATVAFATSTAIPGDIDIQHAKANLEGQSTLTIFAISSLVALCFSITALFSFLAILTSRYEQKDFRRDLPKKILLGLTSLLVSITSMLISFCAGHYFMLKNKLKDKAFPVYAATCLPIVFFAIQQLPLYVDIVWAIFKKVPRSSCKAISL
ncbi:hypothetical protein CFP56_016384 [Quercus suber]|uniref:PGG domain-containing protein n=1 Tax=Quercus suber TaxID=58331 RepID=A0AAW0KPR8_QUESU